MADTPPRLYLITPRVDASSAVLPHLEAALREGAALACVLLRTAVLADRSAKALVEAVAAAVQPFDVALLVEDARLAARAGADGVHLAGSDEDGWSDALKSAKPERIVGVGGALTRDAAMRAGEAGVDYVMFDLPSPEQTADRAAWWAEIFNVPCVAVAHAAGDVERLAASGAEFVALGEEFWLDPRGLSAVVREAQAALARIADAAGVQP